MLLLFKQGCEENVALCTTLGRESEENHVRSEDIIETRWRNEATVRCHVSSHGRNRVSGNQ